jgi:hypothetical protein
MHERNLPEPAAERDFRLPVVLVRKMRVRTFSQRSMRGWGSRASLAVALAVAMGVIFAPAPPAEAASDLWVDPSRGRDSAAGTKSSPLRTLSEAWGRLPAVASTPTTIQLRAGDYRGRSPVYWEDHSGTATSPVVIRSFDGRGKALLPAVNLFGVSWIEFRGIKFRDGGDVVHCEQCSHFTLRNSIVEGVGAQETFKANQSEWVSILDSSLRGAGDNVVDMVAVRHIRLRRNRIAGAGDWCGYAKGGSVDVIVTSNLFTRCGTGGFSAGQGTGFQFMEPPWLHYEAIGVVIRGNTVTETEGAAFGVQGGFGVLVEDNVARRVGRRSHVLEVVFGGRSCDGQPGDPGRERCQQYLDQGGWGTTVVDDGSNGVDIPSRHVQFAGNVILNPAPYRSTWQHLTVFGETGPQPGTGAPSEGAADTDLRFYRNVIWNGAASMPLGVEEGTGCAPSNPTCNPAQLRADNRINTRLPVLKRLRTGRWVKRGWSVDYTRHTRLPPDWSGLPSGSPPWTSWPS